MDGWTVAQKEKELQSWETLDAEWSGLLTACTLPALRPCPHVARRSLTLAVKLFPIVWRWALALCVSGHCLVLHVGTVHSMYVRTHIVAPSLHMYMRLMQQLGEAENYCLENGEITMPAMTPSPDRALRKVNKNVEM